MDLTEQEKEKILKSFYAEKLIGLAEKYKSENREFFQLSADENADSYYIERNDDGNYIHEINYADLEGELHNLWKDEPEELKNLAAPLIELAHKLEEPEEKDGEVSPFIYAMF